MPCRPQHMPNDQTAMSADLAVLYIRKFNPKKFYTLWTEMDGH